MPFTELKPLAMKHARLAESCRAHNSHLLLIAYGNPLRRDDGAGAALADALAATWQAQGLCIRQCMVVQLTPELALAIADPAVQAVIFTDTEFTDAGRAPLSGALHVRRLAATLASPSLGHHMEPALLLNYAQLFNPRLPPAWLVTVAGCDFDLGDGFSPEVQRTLASAPQFAAGLLTQLKRAGVFAAQGKAIHA